MDPASMLVGAGLLLLGWIVGRIARLKARPANARPFCLCTHAFGTHDPTSGVCSASMLVGVTQKNGRVVDERIDCACQRYVGPDPIACGLWVPPTPGERRELS